jgi:hypothetical protein
MPHHSPYLRRPTRLTKKVTRTTTAEKPISMDHGDAETGSFIRLNQYRLIEEIGQVFIYLHIDLPIPRFYRVLTGS